MVETVAIEDATLGLTARLLIGHLLRAVLIGIHLTHAWQRASSAAQQARRDACGCTGAISRARARARAHLAMVAHPCFELGSIQCGQLWVTILLTHV